MASFYSFLLCGSIVGGVTGIGIPFSLIGKSGESSSQSRDTSFASGENGDLPEAKYNHKCTEIQGTWSSRTKFYLCLGSQKNTTEEGAGQSQQQTFEAEFYYLVKGSSNWMIGSIEFKEDKSTGYTQKQLMVTTTEDTSTSAVDFPLFFDRNAESQIKDKKLLPKNTCILTLAEPSNEENKDTYTLSCGDTWKIDPQKQTFKFS